MKKIWILAVLLLLVLTVALWPTPQRFRYGLATAEHQAAARQAAALAEQVNWKEVHSQAVRDLQEYLAKNSVNPPGGTQEAAAWLVSRLQSEGIDAVMEETSPGRFNVIGTLKGSGALKPILLVHHIDVVSINPSEWEHNPLGGEVIDGEIWGRGAIDDKGPTIMSLAAMIALKRSGIPLDRDYVFIASADEEVGGDLGAKILISRHPEWSQAELALYVDGTWGVDIQGQSVFPVGVAEKASVALRLSYEGQGGHSSFPAPDQPLRQLASAMERLASAGQEVDLSPEAVELFGRLGARMGGVKGWLLQRLSWAPVRWIVMPTILKDHVVAATMRNTVAWSALNGGSRYTQIPDRAEAMMDLHFLPGGTPEETMEWIMNTLNLPGVKVEEVYEFRTPSRTPFQTPPFALTEAVYNQVYPEAVVTPFLNPFQSDARHLRPAGIPTYTLVPAYLPNELIQTAHSKNERIPVKALEQGSRFLFTYMVTMG